MLKCLLRPVRVQAGSNVKNRVVKKSRDPRIISVVGEQMNDGEQASHGPGQLGGVKISVHPLGRLLDVGTSVIVGHRNQPDGTAFVTLSKL